MPDGDGSESDFLMRIEHGAKMVLLMEILKECEVIGDKVGDLLTKLTLRANTSKIIRIRSRSII